MKISNQLSDDCHVAGATEPITDDDLGVQTVRLEAGDVAELDIFPGVVVTLYRTPAGELIINITGE